MMTHAWSVREELPLNLRPNVARRVVVEHADAWYRLVGEGGEGSLYHVEGRRKLPQHSYEPRLDRSQVECHSMKTFESG